jgi:glycosyltransferase involved in cell wall biosynthesis/GT2 family glycosyltransferase
VNHLRRLRRRIYLTYRYRGLGTVAYRVLTFPLRLTPLKPYLRLEHRVRLDRSVALKWYRVRGRPATIVIPSYRDAKYVVPLVRSIRRTTRTAWGLLGPRNPVRIVIADDASGPEHLAALRRLKGVEIVAGTCNEGFAANVNRGIAAAPADHDVVVLNSDMIARRGWLACLQYEAHRGDEVGVVGGKLLYPDGLIQSAGSIRNPEAPEWFDHRYRGKPSGYGPANAPGSVLAVCGACMYIRRSLLDRIGQFDPAYGMGYEDVDFCLRSWQAGFRVVYSPHAELYHYESISRGMEQGERELASQRLFWERWESFFEARDVRTPEGALRIIYVTEGTGIGGGHRVVFEQINGLVAAGHQVELWSLDEAPDWFDLHAPVRTFEKYDELLVALTPIDAIKVATWWTSAPPVWEGSVVNGIPVYFVQDIESSYYPDSEWLQYAVLASYRHEFRYLTTSSWNEDQLRRLGLESTVIAPAIDHRTFRPLDDAERRADMILAVGRSNPLKNFPLTMDAYEALGESRPELCLFGIEPELVADDPNVRYVDAPSDEEVNRLLNEATVFVQTSTHEGFCLPVLEAMATGCPVVCTDADGNRDFCADGRNCLMPDPEPAAVADALSQALRDRALRERLGEAAVRTAAEYNWRDHLEALERFLAEVAAPPVSTPS